MHEAKSQIEVTITFYSFFKDSTGCPACSESLPPGSTLADLISKLSTRFPKLGSMNRSMLTAVGIEYQDRNYVLRDGDQVSLFPPVQGG